MKYLQVQTTFEKEKEAKLLAEKIIKKKLASCVQILPIKSLYKWKGKIKKTKEYLCLIKTKQKLISEVIMFIKKNHSYETPEIIATKITAGNNKYLKWINEETK